MKDILKISIVKNIKECELLWREFSPQKTLFDLWSFRSCCWKVYKFEPYFILLRDDGKNVGLLPLWFNHEISKYYWLGDVGDDFNWPESNDFWLKDKRYAANLLKACPSGTVLNSIQSDLIQGLSNSFPFKASDPKYVLDLSSFKTVDDYLATLNKKLRSNLRRDKKRIDNLKPVIRMNHFSDFKKLVEFNTRRFEDSPFWNEKWVKTFLKVINNGKKGGDYQSRIISVLIDGKVVSVDLVFIFRDVYYAFVCGSDLEKCPGIGNYMNLLDIEDALGLNISMIDFCEDTESSHKRKFFSKIGQFSLTI